MFRAASRSACLLLVHFAIRGECQEGVTYPTQPQNFSNDAFFINSGQINMSDIDTFYETIIERRQQTFHFVRYINSSDECDNCAPDSAVWNRLGHVYNFDHGKETDEKPTIMDGTKYNVRIYDVDCFDPESKALCKDQLVSQYPSYKHYGRHTTEQGFVVWLYHIPYMEFKKIIWAFVGNWCNMKKLKLCADDQMHYAMQVKRMSPQRMLTDYEREVATLKKAIKQQKKDQKQWQKYNVAVMKHIDEHTRASYNKYSLNANYSMSYDIMGKLLGRDKVPEPEVREKDDEADEDDHSKIGGDEEL